MQPLETTRGALIVVGGHSRGVGKTTTVIDVIRSQPRAWTAVKVSAHRHAGEYETDPLIEEDPVPTPETQTGRYLLAGASRAFLLRAPSAQVAAAGEFVTRLCETGVNVVVESNRIVDFVTPDLVLFVVAPRIADWKPSSGVMLRRLDAFVIRDDAPVSLEAVRALAAQGRTAFALGHDDETARFETWLAGRLTAAPREPCIHVLAH